MLRKRYRDHKASAKQRGIPFLLTFEQWLQIWTDSGHLDERGAHKGEYVMARYGDSGAYEVGNVDIVTAEKNCSEAALNLSDASRAKIGAAVTAKAEARRTAPEYVAACRQRFLEIMNRPRPRRTRPRPFERKPWWRNRHATPRP
jgi:hypothetical protein